jgi:VWFA-related protein
VRFLNRLSRAFVCALLLSAVAYAQEPAPTTQAPARVEIMLTGGKGRATPELKREDVHVYVDGVERPVVTVDKEVLPVSYGLVVDNSGSLRSQANAVVAAAKYMVGRNGPDDEAFVVRFVSSDNIQILQTLTGESRALNNALDSMRIQGGQTAMLDALYTAGDYLIKNASRADATKRSLALVLVTDGEDRKSTHKAEEVLKLLKDGGVRVYSLGLTAELEDNRGFIGKGKRQMSKDLLLKIAEETGGRVYYAEKDLRLELAVGDIADDVRTRYVVGYAPPEPGGKGKIEVKVGGTPGKEKLKAEIFKDSRQ